MAVFITELMQQPGAVVRLSNPDAIHLGAKPDEIEITHGGERIAVPVAESLKSALEWLMARDGPAPLSALRERLGTQGDAHFGILQAAGFILQNLITLGIACPQNRLLAEIEYAGVGKHLPDMSAPPQLEAGGRFTLSRFCYLHREDDRLLLSLPLKDKRFVIREPAVGALLVELALGADANRLRAACGDDDDLSAGFGALLNILIHESFVVAATDAARLPTRLEEGDDVMAQWDFHDLICHAHSRLGYNFGAEFGGAFPFVNRIEPRPAVKPPPEGERIALYKPDLATLASRDKPLTRVVIQRASVRGYDEESPISLTQIGEFFFRTGRVLYESQSRVTSVNNPEAQTDMGFAWRPYPTGGASYELEFYLTVDRADGLAPGFYYYAPGSHELVQLSAKTAETEGLIQTAFVSCAQIVRPQALVHIAARFQRVSWKYHNIAYATMLRNTGVVYQTFYLNAVAMGLAGCGLGSGNTELFCRASGNQPHIECNIGEFMLGSVPKGFTYDEVDLASSAALHGAKLSPTAS